MGLLLATRAATPRERPSPPELLEPGASCASSDCHPDLVGRPFMHWDELRDECGKCHVAEGLEHEFETQDPPDACLECHDPVTPDEVVHDPAEEDCLDCHDPHGSEVEGLLVSEPKELCLDCHDEDPFAGEFPHGPADSGECSECHDPHSSPNEQLLVATGNELCADCHDEVADEVESAEFPHDPAEEDCTNCHDPHSGPHPYMLAEEGRAVCNECHDDIVEQAENSAVDHEPAVSDDECLTCHSPHASENEALLRRPVRELCLDCHDEPLNSGGKQLLDIASLLEASEHWHEPVREKGCTECHDPHGSEHFRLLREAYPKTFYADFDLESYGLCFQCHEESLVLRKRTRSATGFRNGDLNLHVLHVNRPHRGRTCRACHDVHASAGPLQVRTTVPYGDWDMPLQFRPRESGGSCRPGCHEKKKYDREAE